MNKKGQFVALLSFFLVCGLIVAFFIVHKPTADVVRIYYTPAYVLNQNFEIKEYYFDLNQNVKYSSFKAFNDLCKNSGFYKKCEAWYEKDCDLTNLNNNFKKYFLEYFDEPYDINVEVKNNKFVISGKYDDGYDDSIIFEQFNVKTEIKPEFNYTLDYDISIFEDLYKNCKVLSCDEDELKEKGCKIIDKPKHKCSIEENYINMEYNLEDNGFINPKILFKIPKSGVL